MMISQNVYASFVNMTLFELENSPPVGRGDCNHGSTENPKTYLN